MCLIFTYLGCYTAMRVQNKGWWRRWPAKSKNVWLKLRLTLNRTLSTLRSDTKHVFRVNLSQISSAIPEISAENPAFVHGDLDLWLLSLTFKLIRTRDETCLPCEVGANPFSGKNKLAPFYGARYIIQLCTSTLDYRHFVVRISVTCWTRVSSSRIVRCSSIWRLALYACRHRLSHAALPACCLASTTDTFAAAAAANWTDSRQVDIFHVAPISLTGLER